MVRVYVANSGGPISVIDTATDTVIANIPVVTFTFDLAMSPDGARIYVVNGGGTISVIDTQTNTVVNTISAIPSPGEVGQCVKYVNHHAN